LKGTAKGVHMTDKPDTARLRALARERLALRPDVLRAFESELDRPGMGGALGDGFARQAAELALTWQGLAALLGSPHARDGELLDIIDAFAAQAPSAEPLPGAKAAPPANAAPALQPEGHARAEREAQPAEPKTSADWVRAAQELARGFIAQANGRYFPPQEALAAQVADELRKRGIHGPSGAPLSAGTIKRHALKGITSGGANKLRGIAGQRGK